MNILFTIYRGLGYGGAEVSTKTLAEQMSKLGHKITIASTQPYEGLDYVLFDEFHAKPFFVQKKILVKFLVRVIKEKGIEIVHCQDRLTSIAGIIAAKRCGVPVVVHFRDFWYACPRSTCVAPDGNIYKVCSYGEILLHYPASRWLVDSYKWYALKSWRKILNLADAKIVSSNMEFERLKMIGLDKDACVIPISRDMKQFSGIKGVAEFRKKYGLNSGDVVVSLIGSLFYTKGVSVALKFMEKVILENSKVKFFIAGDGDLENDVISFKDKYPNNAVYSGRLGFSDVLKLYSVSDIILLPSVWEEPFSGIPLEAGASGKVVVASSRGAAKEIKSEHMVIVNSLDADEWAKIVCELIRNTKRRAEMGAKGRKHINDNYSNEVVAKRIDVLYNSIVKERVRGGK